MVVDTEAAVVGIVEDNTNQNSTQQSKRYSSTQWAPPICFALITVMNLSAWIDLQGIFVELPIMVSLTPEGWALPSIINLCISSANIVPAVVVILRRRQGDKFSEVPYIYTIILVGIISCIGVALFWQKTMFIFGRERSVYLMIAISSLSVLDCTSSLVFFDYMKRFRPQYLAAVFLGEGFTAAIPTLLALLQGSAGTPNCVESVNSTILKPVYSQPRFSVSVFMLLVTVIVIASLIAFVLLRWTTIVLLANATESKIQKEVMNDATDVNNDDSPTDYFITASKSLEFSKRKMTHKTLILLLLINTLNSTVLFGCMPSLSTYALLPYSQDTFYYATILGPIAYPLVSLLSVRWPIVSNRTTCLGSAVGFIFFIFIGIAAWQSPCPWWADTTQGSLFMICIWFLTTLPIAFTRITMGNRIKTEWEGDEGLFYFGASLQLGFLLGSLPVYVMINRFGTFIDRQPCQKYCIE